MDDQPMFDDISDGDSNADSNNAETQDNTDSLKAYREALQQEWETKNDPTNAKETVKTTKEEIRRRLPDYLANMRGLAMGAMSESVRYQANKFLIEAVLSSGGVGQKDTLADLLEEMEEAEKEGKASDA